MNADRPLREGMSHASFPLSKSRTLSVISNQRDKRVDIRERGRIRASKPNANGRICQSRLQRWLALSLLAGTAFRLGRLIREPASQLLIVLEVTVVPPAHYAQNRRGGALWAPLARESFSHPALTEELRASLPCLPGSTSSRERVVGTTQVSRPSTVHGGSSPLPG